MTIDLSDVQHSTTLYNTLYAPKHVGILATETDCLATCLLYEADQALVDPPAQHHLHHIHRIGCGCAVLVENIVTVLPHRR